MSRRNFLEVYRGLIFGAEVEHLTFIEHAPQAILPIPYLEHNLFHLLIRGLELSDENQHHFSGVVVCILSIHQWDQITNSFEESSQTLVTKVKKYCKYNLSSQIVAWQP